MNARKISHQIISRRRWLLASAAICTGSVAAVAQEPPSTGSPDPGVEIAVNEIRPAIIRPTATKTFRLQPTERQLNRTVVTAIATDPRSELVAVAGDDHAIRIMLSPNMRVLHTLRGHRDLVRTMSFDPRGNRLISSGNDGQLIVWDRDAEFTKIQSISVEPAIACVRFSPGGNEIAAVGFDRRILIYGKKSSGRPPLGCDCTDLRAVAYRDDKAMLAVGGRSGELHLFDLNSRELIGEYETHRGRINALEFAVGSSTVVSVGGDGKLVLFDTERKKLIRQMAVTSGKLFAVTILDDRHVAVAGSDNLIRIVNMVTGNTVRNLAGHDGSITSLAADGNVLFSGGYDATLRRWALAGLRGEDRIAERDPKLDR